MNQGPILVDTDILIDFLRDRREAVLWVAGLAGDVHLSTMTIAELYAGVRDGRERETLTAFLGLFKTVPIDDRIARQGGLLRRDWGKSHGAGLADCLIAASALSLDATLATLNRKHFPMLERLLVPYEKA
ncbi:type II toxin-antitoxin system VapC family toxin [uncultured Thiocystis sp.]|uniref:type II toxin-antitoxin system VapC family toxin n=1 Tax=uncultured Thiocystis sp. TaxID=1202134 RepID=UPI0025D4C2F2|nr:type II toxin-antitoxin system VapC family toxin [uncultured Thiocystis sp.]